MRVSKVYKWEFFRKAVFMTEVNYIFHEIKEEKSRELRRSIFI